MNRANRQTIVGIIRLLARRELSALERVTMATIELQRMLDIDDSITKAQQEHKHE